MFLKNYKDNFQESFRKNKQQINVKNLKMLITVKKIITQIGMAKSISSDGRSIK